VVNTAAGTITFSTSFDVTTTTNYILRADFASLSGGDAVTISLSKDDITADDNFIGAVDSTAHGECCYWQCYAEWQATSASTWQTVDLSASPYNVPPDAVLEVAIANANTGAEGRGPARTG
jgi:hypothetical protein